MIESYRTMPEEEGGEEYAQEWVQPPTVRKVLDKGFVRLVDRMGSDSAVVQAARVSYGEGTKSSRDDRGLLRYLMRHHHDTPFEMVQVKLHVKAPIFVARQWFRHRAGSFNEVSARYSEMPDEFYIPEVLHKQAAKNKQGRGEELKGGRTLIDFNNEEAYGSYKSLLVMDVSREEARMVLPVNLYTEFYWSVNLRNLFHFLELRLDEHAQWETRQYAEAIYDIVKLLFPVACEAFEEYRLGAVTFSRSEMSLIASLLDRKTIDDLSMDGHLFEEMSPGEIREFRAKLPQYE